MRRGTCAVCCTHRAHCWWLVSLHGGRAGGCDRVGVVTHVRSTAAPTHLRAVLPELHNDRTQRP